MTRADATALADYIITSEEQWSDGQLGVLADFCEWKLGRRFNRRRWLSYIDAGPGGSLIPNTFATRYDEHSTTVADAIDARALAFERGLETYWCEVCGGWHFRKN